MCEATVWNGVDQTLPIKINQHMYVYKSMNGHLHLIRIVHANTTVVRGEIYSVKNMSFPEHDLFFRIVSETKSY